MLVKQVLASDRREVGAASQLEGLLQTCRQTRWLFSGEQHRRSSPKCTSSPTEMTAHPDHHLLTSDWPWNPAACGLHWLPSVGLKMRPPRPAPVTASAASAILFPEGACVNALSRDPTGDCAPGAGTSKPWPAKAFFRAKPPKPPLLCPDRERARPFEGVARSFSRTGLVGMAIAGVTTPGPTRLPAKLASASVSVVLGRAVWTGERGAVRGPLPARPNGAPRPKPGPTTFLGVLALGDSGPFSSVSSGGVTEMGWGEIGPPGETG
jgi:hypothetical protein